MRSQLAVQVDMFRLQIEQNRLLGMLTEARVETSQRLATHIRHDADSRVDDVSKRYSEDRYYEASREQGKLESESNENQKKLTDLADELAEIEKASRPQPNGLTKG